MVAVAGRISNPGTPGAILNRAVAMPSVAASSTPLQANGGGAGGGLGALVGATGIAAAAGAVAKGAAAVSAPATRHFLEQGVVGRSVGAGLAGTSRSLGGLQQMMFTGPIQAGIAAFGIRKAGQLLGKMTGKAGIATGADDIGKALNLPFALANEEIGSLDRAASSRLRNVGERYGGKFGERMLGLSGHAEQAENVVVDTLRSGMKATGTVLGAVLGKAPKWIGLDKQFGRIAAQHEVAAQAAAQAFESLSGLNDPKLTAMRDSIQQIGQSDAPHRASQALQATIKELGGLKDVAKADKQGLLAYAQKVGQQSQLGTLKNVMENPSENLGKYMQGLTASQIINRGVQASFFATQAYGVGATTVQGIKALRAMIADTQGVDVKKVSGFQALFGKATPAVKEARAHLVRSVLPQAATTLATTVGFALVGKYLGGTKMHGFATMGLALGVPAAAGIFAQHSSLLQLYTGAKIAQERGEEIPQKAYAQLVHAMSPELRKHSGRYGAEGENAMALAAHYFERQAPIAEVLHDMNENKFPHLIGAVAARGVQAQAAAQPGREAVGQFTSRLAAEGQRGLAQAH